MDGEQTLVLLLFPLLMGLNGKFLLFITSVASE